MSLIIKKGGTYVYSDTVPKGKVIRTEPKALTRVKYDSKLVLYVSLGPTVVKARTANVNWRDVGSGTDSWECLGAAVKDGCLYLTCQCKFGTDLSFRANGVGYAGRSDAFETQFPIMLLKPDEGRPLQLPSEKTLDRDMFVGAGQNVSFIIKIPLDGFDTERPGYVACRIGCLVEGEYREISASFGIFW